MKKIKVVQITHDLDLGGLQQVIVNICKSIDRSAFDISILCLRNLGCFYSEIVKLGIVATLIPQKEHGTDYLSFIKVAKYLRNISPDVIHTHNTQPFIDGTIAALFTGVKKIIHTDHARSFPDKSRYMFAEYLMSHFAYKVVGVSDHTSMNLVKYEHIARSKIVTIPNGIDPTPYQQPIDKDMIRAKLGLPKSGPILGVAVRLSEQKGIVYLLNAMPQIISTFSDVSLVIAGDGPLKEDLMYHAKKLYIQKNVFFLGTRLDIPILLKLFDLYVLPSSWEGLPMIVLEAMAAECPVIATDVGGVSTAVTDGITGVLLKPDMLDSLGEKILDLLKNEKKRESFKIAAKERFLSKFSSTIMTRMYEKLYT